MPDRLNELSCLGDMVAVSVLFHLDRNWTRCFPEQRAGTWQRHKLRDTGEMAVRKRPKALTEPSQSRGLPMGIPRPAAKTQLILTNNEQHVSGNSSFAHKGGILVISDPLLHRLNS